MYEKAQKIKDVRSNTDVMYVKKILLDQNVKTVENICKINIVIRIDEEFAKYFLNQDQHCHSHLRR